MIQHNGPISGIAAYKNLVATAGYDNQVILWNASTKTALARGTHDHLANRCEFSPDGRLLASASSDYTARLWQLPDMKLISVFGDHTDDVEVVRFSPCGKRLATASQDGRLRVFLLNGDLIREFAGHRGVVSACAWSEDGQRIVSSGDDGSVRTWDVESGKELQVMRPEDVQTDAVVMTSRGVVYAGNDKGEIIRMVGDSIEKLAVHGAGIKNLVLNQEETHAVTLSYDRKLAYVSLGEVLQVEKFISLPELVWARACVFQDKEHVLLGTFGSTYSRLNLTNEEWDLGGVEVTDCLNAVAVDEGEILTVGDAGEVRRVTGRVSNRLRPSSVIASVGSLCNFITRYQKRWVCGGHLGKLFDAESGETLLTLKCPINKGLQVGNFLVLALYTGELGVCRGNDLGEITLVDYFKVVDNAVKDLSSYGDLIFCGGAASDIAVFDLQRMTLVSHRACAHEQIVNSCGSLGHGSFVSVSRDKHLKIWHGTELIESVRTPHDHSVKCCAVSFDSRWIATCSYDGKIAIYDRETLSWPIVERLTSAGISSVVPDKDRFLAASYDGNVYSVECL